MKKKAYQKDVGRVTKKHLLTTEEAAEYMGVSAFNLREKIDSGQWRIPIVKLGRLHRFDPEDLDAFIDSQKVS